MRKIKQLHRALKYIKDTLERAIKAPSSTDVEIISELIASNRNDQLRNACQSISLQGKTGNALLLCAIENKNEKSVQHLSISGAELFRKTDDKVIDHLASPENFNMLSALLDNNAISTDAFGRDNRLRLFDAVIIKNNKLAIKKLLQLSPSLLFRGDNAPTLPSHLPFSETIYESVYDPSVPAIQIDNVETLKILINYGLDPLDQDARIYKNFTKDMDDLDISIIERMVYHAPFFRAIKNDSHRCVEYILNARDAAINLRHHYTGLSPIEFAKHCGSKRSLPILERARLRTLLPEHGIRTSETPIRSGGLGL